MGPLEIAPGRVEQALYTWSKSSLSGEKGQGFTAASAGLRERIDWLSSRDLSGIAEFESGVTEAGGFPEWRKMVSTGAFTTGPVRIVYRKIARVGVDEFGRNRSAIHMLVARVEELDFASIADDDPNWLTVEGGPLDRLRELEVLDLAALAPRRADHECAAADASAVEILRQLVVAPHVLERELGADPAEPGAFVSQLLAAVPTRFWRAIEIDWRVGRQGPIVRVEMTGEARGPATPGRADAAALGACELHRVVDEKAATLGPGGRPWESFSAAWSTHPPSSPAVARGAGREAGPARPGPGDLDAIVGSAIGSAHWNPGCPLTDAQAGRALKAIGERAQPGWLRGLSPHAMRAIFGAAEPVTVGRVIPFFDTSAVPTTDLVTGWQESGLAVVGAAMLARMQREDAETEGESRHWRVVPRQIDSVQLQRLVTHLSRTEKGLNQLAILLGSGFLEYEDARREIVAAIVAVDPRPRFLFETVLDREQLEPRLLVPVLREELDRFAQWKNLGTGVHQALSLGLREHRSPLERLFHQLRRGTGATAEPAENSRP